MPIIPLIKTSHTKVHGIFHKIYTCLKKIILNHQTYFSTFMLFFINSLFSFLPYFLHFTIIFTTFIHFPYLPWMRYNIHILCTHIFFPFIFTFENLYYILLKQKIYDLYEHTWTYIHICKGGSYRKENDVKT